MSELTASVVITTKNRKEELLKAIASALEQIGLLEVLVMDGGSGDGTEEALAEMLKSRKAEKRERAVEGFEPEFRVVWHEVSQEYIVRQNEAARIARGDVIFSLDDDAFRPFTSRAFASRMMEVLSSLDI